MNLRDYQVAFLGDINMAFAAGARRVLGVMPTGAGKTVCFNHLADRWDGRVGIFAHRRELIRQASQKYPGQHGIIAPWAPQKPRARVQIGSIQTMARRLERVLPFDLSIFDEAHHAIAGQWRKFIESQPGSLVLGVTATPERLDKRGLAEAFDVLVQGPQIADLMADGYLTRARVFAPKHVVDLSAVRTLAGDFNAGQLAEVMDRGGLTGDAVDHYARIVGGAPAIAFCASVAHAEHVAASFRAAGFRAEAVSGDLDETTRDRRIAGLADGTVQVLTSCDLISEGLDIPVICAVIMLRPTQSLGLFLQMVGRGLRPIYAAGFDTTTRAARLAAIANSFKPAMLLLDHAGNVLRHGMPDQRREWSLEGRKKKKSEESAPPVRQCPMCQAIHLAAVRACPECGFVYAADACAARVEPKTHEGELIEAVAPLPRLVDLLDAAKDRSEVEAIRVARGYQQGWTEHVMRGRSKRGAPWWQNQTTAAQDFGIT